MATLVEFWTTEKQTCEAVVARVRDQLAPAQRDLGTAQKALADATADIGTKDRAVADVRRALAAVPASPDGAALLAELEADLIALRDARGVALELQGSVDDARPRIARMTAVAQRAAADAADATTALALAEKRAKERSDWNDRLAGPLAHVVADAGTLRNGPELAAVAAWAADVPAKLLEAASKRRAARMALIGAGAAATTFAEDARAAARAQNDGNDGTVAKLRLAYDRARAALGDWVAGAAERLGRAQAVIDGLVDTSPGGPRVKAAFTLTDAEKQRLTDLKAKGDAAATQAVALADAEKALAASELQLLEAEMKAETTKPEADPAADADVHAAVTARDAARADRDGKKLAAEPAADLAAWEAALPDATWQRLLDFTEATASLDSLVAGNPQTLSDALTAAETALAAALDTAAKSRRAAGLWDTIVAEQSDRAKAAEGRRAAETLSAFRGDF